VLNNMNIKDLIIKQLSLKRHNVKIFQLFTLIFREVFINILSV
jgi:hypothetical protein